MDHHSNISINIVLITKNLDILAISNVKYSGFTEINTSYMKFPRTSNGCDVITCFI